VLASLERGSDSGGNAGLQAIQQEGIGV